MSEWYKRNPKFRVLFESNLYYPQRKGWLFWNNFFSDEVDNVVICFDNETAACNFIDKKIAGLNPCVVKEWEIESTYE